MERFPDDLSEILTPLGRELLEGCGEAAGVLQRVPFYASSALIEPAFARAAAGILQRAFGDILWELNVGLPSAKSSPKANFDTLPKVARMLSTPHDAQVGDDTWKRAEGCGLIAMLGSPSYVRFVAALCGHPVDGPAGMQAFCFRPGDYAGPHTDHHPDDPGTRDGYTDVHLTFCSEGVEQQYLVYANGRHFSKMVDLSRSGTVTAYRLPIWHYTTPMQGAEGARRWLVLGTFTHPGRGPSKVP